MKNYEKDIINRLLDIYERRGAFRKEIEEIRAISIGITDGFPEYADTYNHAAYQEINMAVEALSRNNLISAKISSRGTYGKIKLRIENVDQAYTFVKRKPLINKYEELQNVLDEYAESGFDLLNRLIADFNDRISAGKKLPYGIEYNADRLKDVLMILQSILKLPDETYVRNFSNALFKDSKVFQKEFRSTIQSILYDYTETAVEKDRILEVYNLYENPTYVMMKGNAIIHAGTSEIRLLDLTGGISIPESALENIAEIQVLSPNVITVENLTTFHDCTDSDNLYIYLGGFHNHSKEILLKKIYAQNPDRKYFHKGDLDVYGFAILESLKSRTGIPFEPLEMNLETLDRFFKAGLYKNLTEADKKAMKAANLQQYEEIFQYMITHNCKVEQESIKAIELI